VFESAVILIEATELSRNLRRPTIRYVPTAASLEDACSTSPHPLAAPPVAQDTSASSGSKTPPAASQNSDATTAAKISIRTPRNETAAQMPLSATSSPQSLFGVNGERNHFGMRGNVATANE